MVQFKVWVESKGSKSITYIIGHNLTDTEVKYQLKIIKKKLGCNGTTKKITTDKKQSIFTDAILLQGNHEDFINEYFTNNNMYDTLYNF